jgi:glycine/D-amino acid oxidase-like deaminating enzyme
MASDSIRNIVVVGGGIIGCSTAYYLTRHPSFVSSRIAITLIEASAHGAAQGASGKAGGLVAKWAYPKELVNVSFNEHVKLANEHGGTDRWG